MPRAPRRIAPGSVHHIVNRGNDRREIFSDPSHNEVFLRLMRLGLREYPVTVHHYCNMRNHFHAIVRSETANALSEYMQWFEGVYATHWRTSTGTLGYGHVFQRRFWNGEITSDQDYLWIARYIEANPLRAGLVYRAEHWKWSSLAERMRGLDQGTLLSPPLVQLPAHWVEIVNLIQREETLRAIRARFRRKKPMPPDA